MVSDGDRDRWSAIRALLVHRFGIDERALAAYRIAIAALVVADVLVYRLPDLGAFYTDAGVLPRSLLTSVFPVAAELSLHTLAGSLAGQLLLALLTVAAAGALLVGYRTRWAAAATWILVASMQARNPHVLNAGDTLVLATLFFGLFLPLGARWSLDARSGTERGEGVVTSPATVGILLQVVIVYATNAVFKTRSPGWTDGTAVQRIFALDDFTIRLGDALAAVPELLVAANWVWFAALAASPLLVLLAGWPRAAYAGLLAVLHLGMLATLMLGLFPLVSIAALLLLVPPVAWDRLEPHIDGLASALEHRLPARSSTEPTSRLPSSLRRAGRDAVHAGLAVLVVAGLAWHAMAVGLFAQPGALEELGRAGEHEWRMFAPASTTYGYVEAPAELATGERVDAIQQAPHDREPPDDLAEAYPSTLWHRYLKDLPDVTDAEQAALAAYLCQRTADAHEAPVESVRLVYVEHEVRLDEPDPVERYTLHTHDCETG